MQSLQAVQAPVSGNESLDLAPAEAAGSFPPFSLEGVYLWCLYLGSQFALLSIFLNGLHHQMFYWFFCLWHGKERGKKSQGKKKIQAAKKKKRQNKSSHWSRDLRAHLFQLSTYTEIFQFADVEKYIESWLKYKF